MLCLKLVCSSCCGKTTEESEKDVIIYIVYIFRSPAVFWPIAIIRTAELDNNADSVMAYHHWKPNLIS